MAKQQYKPDSKRKPDRKAEREAASRKERLRDLLIRLFPAWVILCGVIALGAPNFRNFVEHLITVGSYAGGGSSAPAPAPRVEVSGEIAPLFTSEVDYWRDDIVRWGRLYSADPNLIATVIQIESCGDPSAASPAGAQGLMQVMPDHFLAGEDMLDPETNAMRGIRVLTTECLFSAYNVQNDVGLALACYNGGPSVFVNPMRDWHPQSQYYYTWGTGIYADARANRATSATLDDWLAAGGAGLCANARLSLGLAQGE